MIPWFHNLSSLIVLYIHWLYSISSLLYVEKVLLFMGMIKDWRTDVKLPGCYFPDWSKFHSIRKVFNPPNQLCLPIVAIGMIMSIVEETYLVYLFAIIPFILDPWIAFSTVQIHISPLISHIDPKATLPEMEILAFVL